MTKSFLISHLELTFAKPVVWFRDLLLRMQLNQQLMIHDLMCIANEEPNYKHIAVIVILMYPDHRTVINAIRNGNFVVQVQHAFFLCHQIIEEEFLF